MTDALILENVTKRFGHTPFVMMNRAAGDVAARVFRVGVLMTGQPPSLRQLIRLVRSAS